MPVADSAAMAGGECEEPAADLDREERAVVTAGTFPFRWQSGRGLRSAGRPGPTGASQGRREAIDTCLASPAQGNALDCGLAVAAREDLLGLRPILP